MSDQVPTPSFCISVDVERDYRLDGKITVRGIEEGLPVFLDALRSRSVPFDLLVLGEIVQYLASDFPKDVDALESLGCLVVTYSAGLLGYLRRYSDSLLGHDLVVDTR